jgi:acyl-CoA synthetase (AMP-forming)/AMP-acid ligase II
MIIRGGENIYPRELEELLFRHPKIGEVAVIGLPHEKWGEEVAAFIRPAPGAVIDKEELSAYMRVSLRSAQDAETLVRGSGLSADRIGQDPKIQAPRTVGERRSAGVVIRKCRRKIPRLLHGDDAETPRDSYDAISSSPLARRCAARSASRALRNRWPSSRLKRWEAAKKR